MKRSSQSRKLGLEQFESRQLMAGNVSVNVDLGGDLHITGDDLGNGVQIAQARTSLGTAIRGTYFITGENAAGAATTINGQASVIIRNVTDDVLIDLRGGADLLTTPSGAGRHFFADDVTINLGEGNNTVILRNISTFDDVAINGGSSNDQIFIEGGIIGNSVFNPDADFTANTFGGFDGVSLRNTLVRDDVTVDTGLGDFADSVSLLTGNVGDDVTIFTHDGRDTVIVDHITINDNLVVDTGNGDDRLTMRDSDVDELFAFMGSDNDTVELTNVSGRRGTLAGGTGVDSLATFDVAFDEFFSTSGF